MCVLKGDSSSDEATESSIEPGDTMNGYIVNVARHGLKRSSEEISTIDNDNDDRRATTIDDNSTAVTNISRIRQHNLHPFKIVKILDD